MCVCVCVYTRVDKSFDENASDMCSGRRGYGRNRIRPKTTGKTCARVTHGTRRKCTTNRYGREREIRPVSIAGNDSNDMCVYVCLVNKREGETSRRAKCIHGVRA